MEKPARPSRLALPLLLLATLAAACGAPADLAVTTYTSDATFAVSSYLIAGPREAILVDGQFSRADAEKVAQVVRASGKTLKLIYLSHAHPDHYLGLSVLQGAFPGVPVQALPEVVADFNAKAAGTLAALQKAFPAGTLPDQLATVTALSGDRLAVDGEELRVLRLPEGEASVSGALYAPRQGLLFAGDNVYNGAYLWLAECKLDGWAQNIATLRALQPLAQIYPGHGPAPATAAVFDENLAYLRDVPPILNAAPDAPQAIARVKQRYPAYTGAGLLENSTPGYLSACKR